MARFLFGDDHHMGIDCGNSRLNTGCRHGGFEIGYAALAEKGTI